MLNRLGKNRSSGTVYGLTAESLGMDMLLILCGALGRPIIMQYAELNVMIRISLKSGLLRKFSMIIIEISGLRQSECEAKPRCPIMSLSHCTAEAIADFFASKYKDLYSSVAYDAHEMLDVHTEVDHLTSCLVLILIVLLQVTMLQVVSKN